MAKYEHFRTYVVSGINKRENSISVVSPKARSFQPLTVWDVPVSVLRGLKVGQKLRFVRVSDKATTFYEPRFR